MFIKDISYYLSPPDGRPASLAPSIAHHANHKRGVGTNDDTTGDNGFHFDAECPETPGTESKNPTVIPEAVLKKFHFAFLIRHPRSAVPSYYRCTIPPLDEQTGFHDFMPSEMGYDEQRRLFDFLRSVHQVGPEIAGRRYGPANSRTNGLMNGNTNGHTDENTNGHDTDEPPQVQICVIDADDLLDDPEGTVQQFCKSVDLEYNPSMLVWDTEEDHQQATQAFEKWKGWHNDVLASTSLKPRAHVGFTLL